MSTSSSTTTRPSHHQIGEPSTLPCEPWCRYQDVKTEDCLGAENRVVASLYERLPYDRGEWGDEYFTVYPASSRLNDKAPHVELGLGETLGYQLTPSEARQVAAALLAAADTIEAAS